MKSVLITTLFLLSTNAKAWIGVEAGKYELNALVTPFKNEVQVVFNLRSKSETRVTLTGKVAKKLMKVMKGPDSYHLQFQVSEKVVAASRIQAELISFRKVMPNEKVPFMVGNNFKEIPYSRK